MLHPYSSKSRIKKLKEKEKEKEKENRNDLDVLLCHDNSPQTLLKLLSHILSSLNQ